MAEYRPYLAQIDDFDENQAEGICEIIQVLASGMHDYAQRLLDVINRAPNIDLPLVLTAMKYVRESLLVTDQDLRATAEALEALPISMIAVTNQGGRGENNG